MPQISQHFARREPSAIRQAQIDFAARPDRDRVTVINLAIGNVSLPMHPAMMARLQKVAGKDSPFAAGVVKYTASVGTDECQQAILNVIASAGVDTSSLGCVVTDGGSLAMELMILGVCGPGSTRPLMLLDPAYTNYMDMARRVATPTVSLRRELGDDGVFTVPDLEKLARLIREHKPTALVIIPADNPTGQFLDGAAIEKLARLCVEHDMWLVSDEAYRQLHYAAVPVSSVWKLRNQDVPGIEGSRVSIESASKVFNACGLRIGALVTDNAQLKAKALAEYTANLCSNAIGQHVFGALAHVSHQELAGWYDEQRGYYKKLMTQVADGLRAACKGIIVSQPQSALYSVVDVRRVVKPGFRSVEFVRWCAKEGRAQVGGKDHTLLAAPMGGFFGSRQDPEPSDTQMRFAFVEPPAEMAKVPELFASLLRAYEAQRR